MVRTVIEKVFPCSISKVWETITDNEHVNWRSDLSRVEVIDDTHFIEYTKKNYPTSFRIVTKDPYQYCFTMENGNFTGKFTGILEETAGGVKFTSIEEVTTSNIVLRILAPIYLKRQQNRYMADLEKALQGEMK